MRDAGRRFEVLEQFDTATGRSGDMMRLIFSVLVFAFGAVAAHAQSGAIYADGVLMPTVQKAFDTVKPGGIVRLEPGIYKEGAILKKDHDGVLITGGPGVIFDGVTVGGKAAFVIQSDDITMEGIECINMKVGSGNGACIRHESGNLTLRNVNFSHNENGILTWSNSQKILIEDSIFEGNGKGGRSHGMYIGDAKQLIVRRTQVIGSKDQGHGIKSRAEHTLIENSVIASLLGDDSYLIDIPNGGNAVIRNSLLVEGANTANWFILAYGMEKQEYALNNLRLEKNVIISDREGGSKFLNLHEKMPRPILRGNVIVGDIDFDWTGNNFFFDGRSDLKWPAAPALPDIDLSKK